MNDRQTRDISGLNDGVLHPEETSPRGVTRGAVTLGHASRGMAECVVVTAYARTEYIAC